MSAIWSALDVLIFSIPWVYLTFFTFFTLFDLTASSIGRFFVIQTYPSDIAGGIGTFFGTE